MSNYGIDWVKEKAELKGDEFQHIKGVSPKSIFAIPKHLRELYLPKGERQNVGEEKMDCVSRAVCNWYESELTYAYKNSLLLPANEKWLEDNGYVNNDGQVEISDAFVAIGSGTTRQGNSLKAPIDWARKNGVIPKKLMPQLLTFEENHNPTRMLSEYIALGREFVLRFTTNYDQIQELQFALNDDDAIVAVYAWPKPVNGVYPRVDLQPNHAVRRFVKLVIHEIFDNYDVAGVFIKHLAQNFNFMDYGYRCYFTSQQVPEKKSALVNLRDWIKDSRVFAVLYAIFYSILITIIL